MFIEDVIEKNVYRRNKSLMC